MSLPAKGKILALDLGNRRTGVAVSDKDQKVAFLRDELEHQSDAELLSLLKSLAEQEDFVGILVGMPLRLSGEASPQTIKVEEQIKQIKESLNLPIATIDERFSTQEAFAPKMKVVDSRSAQILLENYFSSLKS